MTSYPRTDRWSVGLTLLLSLAGWLVFLTPLRAEDPGIQATPSGTTTEAEEALQNLLDDRGLVVFQKVVADFNADDVLDVAAHVALPEAAWERAARARAVSSESALVIALGPGGAGEEARVVANIPNGMLCPYCPIGSQDDASQGRPVQSLKDRDGRLEVCEQWGSRWFVQTCDTLRLGAGVVEVEHHLVRNGWRVGPSEHVRAFDFNTAQGQRSYQVYPVEAGYPVLSQAAEFAMLVAQPVSTSPVLDGSLDDEAWSQASVRVFESGDAVIHGRSAWSGAADLSMELRTLWTPEALWLGIEIDDDVAVIPRCDEPRTLLRSDHLELWIDTGRDLHQRGTEPRIEEHRALYQEAPIRHEPDEALHNITLGVGSEGTVCLQRFLPRERIQDSPDADPLTIGLQAEASQLEDGRHQLEIVIPAAFFGVDNLERFEGRIEGLGFAVAAYDADDSEAPQQDSVLATSTLQWGDPYSLGMLVMPSQRIGLPAFPFDWSSWIGD